jgi:hypothetical protein
MALEIYLQYFTKNGEVIDKNVGMTTVEKLTEFIEKNINDK